jgi:hypothetical protein
MKQSLLVKVKTHDLLYTSEIELEITLKKKALKITLCKSATKI